MWIASVLGFYSIVKKGGSGQWQIRGRERRDLLNILEAVRLPTERLLVSRDTDYAYRIIVDANELERVVCWPWRRASITRTSNPRWQGGRTNGTKSARTIAFGQSWLSYRPDPAH